MKKAISSRINTCVEVQMRVLHAAVHTPDRAMRKKGRRSDLVGRLMMQVQLLKELRKKSTQFVLSA